MNKFLIIAGPCCLESEDLVMKVAETVASVKNENIEVYFKGSFDKANRTSINSVRGPGIDLGLKWLQKVKDEFNLPVLTDIHYPEQASIAAEVCDVLQIPAFLSRQTDLLLSAAKTNKIINIKKGQFLSPYDMQHVVKKVKNSKIWLTERGSSFGYNNLVVDMRSIPIMKEFGAPVIIDASHGVQLPGGLGAASSGDRKFVPIIAKAGVAAGADGLFIETHIDPDNAVSDKNSQLNLKDFRQLVCDCFSIYGAMGLAPFF